MELQEGRGRRNHSRHVLPLALCSRPHVWRRCRRSRAPARRTFPSVSTRRATRYTCTAEDAAYGMFELKGGIFAQINSSWATRVYRDELFSLQVDGTEGSAVAGLARVQSAASRQHAAAGLESRPAQSISISRSVGRSSRQRRIRQCVQGAVGDVSAPRR